MSLSLAIAVDETPEGEMKVLTDSKFRISHGI